MTESQKMLLRVVATAIAIIVLASIVQIVYYAIGMTCPDNVATSFLVAFVVLPVLVLLAHAPGM